MLREKVTEFYVSMDDFYKEFENQVEFHPELNDPHVKRRNRKGKFSDSEMMAIYLLFHFGQFTNFKHFYNRYLKPHLSDLFPDLVSYERFNVRQERILIPLILYLKCKGMGKTSGINYIDSTLLRVCHIKRKSNTKSSRI